MGGTAQRKGAKPLDRGGGDARPLHSPVIDDLGESSQARPGQDHAGERLGNVLRVPGGERGSQRSAS